MLNLADYPRKAYGGAYFEILMNKDVIEGARDAAIKDVLKGASGSVEVLRKLQSDLEAAFTDETLLARIYVRAEPTGEPGHAKEFSNVVADEFLGTQQECEDWIVAQMPKYKIGA